MKLVAFDFDGTITKKDTFLQFILYCNGRKALIKGVLTHLHLIIGFKLKLYPNWKVKQIIFSYFFKGIHKDQFEHWCIDFADEIDKIIHNKALETIKMHQNNSSILLIVSASIENWIIPWAERWGINIVIGTKVEIDNQGHLTGRFYTKNCYGKEKCNRILELFPDRSSYTLYAYGDSRGDRELLELADKGFFKIF